MVFLESGGWGAFAQIIPTYCTQHNNIKGATWEMPHASGWGIPLWQLKSTMTKPSLEKKNDNVGLHPWKLTWNPKMEFWKMISLFKQVIFRFHVNFPGCISWDFGPWGAKGPRVLDRVMLELSKRKIFPLIQGLNLQIYCANFENHPWNPLIFRFFWYKQNREINKVSCALLKRNSDVATPTVFFYFNLLWDFEKLSCTSTGL